LSTSDVFGKIGSKLSNMTDNTIARPLFVKYRTKLGEIWQISQKSLKKPKE